MQGSGFKTHWRPFAAFIGVWWAIYGALILVLEPFGSNWFGASPLPLLGGWGHVLLLIIPIVLAFAFFYWPSIRRAQIEKKYLGLISVSTGAGRIEAFQEISGRARHRIVIVGIGMTNLSKYARKTLAKNAELVPIDFLMMDPNFLESNLEFARKLEDFLDIPEFTAAARSSFNTLKSFVDDWNSDPAHRHRMGLKVYNTIPTMSMILIDPGESTAEILIEFFLYRSGEYRPRLHMRPIDAADNLFNRVKTEHTALWDSARRVV